MKAGTRLAPISVTTESSEAGERTKNVKIAGNDLRYIRYGWIKCYYKWNSVGLFCDGGFECSTARNLEFDWDLKFEEFEFGFEI